MNQSDELIFDYLKNISTQDSPEKSLAVTQLLKDKSYSNINVQDERGNTFAHYCVEAVRWDWFEKIMRHGADMDIRNKNYIKVLHSVHKEEDLEDFYKDIINIRLGHDFLEKTQGYAVNFKQYIYEDQVKNKLTALTVFESEKDIVKFLSENELFTDKNFLELLALSIQIKEKIPYQVKYFNSPENNSYFLNKLCNNNSFMNRNGSNDFELLLSQPLANNEDLYTAFAVISNNNKRSDYDLMVMMLQAIVDQKIDITVNHGWTRSLENLFNSRKPFKELYDNIKNIYTLNNALQQDLAPKEEKQPKIKI
jgi:hypothetical protein